MGNDVSCLNQQGPVYRSTDSRAKAQLGKEAIRCALNGAWEQAAAANRQILEICPTDCEASNRLAKALIELGDYPEARRTLQQLQLHSPTNVIARKNLARLDQLQSHSGEARPQTAVTGKSPGMFISESGKSCTTTLRQQAGQSVIASVSAGDAVLLSPQNEGVTVSTLDGHYLGTLQRRLGRRVNRLMAGGNEYEAAVVGLEEDALSVILRETGQAPALRQVVSFPAQVSEASPPGRTEQPYADVAPVNDEFDPASADTLEADEIVESAESEVIELSDDNPIESVGVDDVPMLDTDDEPDDWTPIAPTATDEEEWD